MTESPSEVLLLRNPPRGTRRFVLLENNADRVLDALADDLAAFTKAEERFEASLVKQLMHWSYPFVMFIMNSVLTKLDLFPALRAAIVFASLAWSALLIGGAIYEARVHRRGELLFAQTRMFTTLVQVEAVKPAGPPQETS